jgi:hypothetical protein
MVPLVLGNFLPQKPKLLEGFRNLAMAIPAHVNFAATRCEHFQTFPFQEAM